jgi:hypothetical protein
MENLPQYIGLVFGITTFLTILIFYKAANNSKLSLLILFTWMVIQGLMAYSGFYAVADTFPPRFSLFIVPPLFMILVLFNTQKGKSFLDGLNPKILTILHIVRIPVEIILYMLFVNKTIPELMTFEGRNFDILAGITAPFIFYFGFVKNKINKNLLLTWNFICLALLINIVVNAILSAPTPFQQFAFDQPNIAIFHFPYIWLPCCIVPLVFLSHFGTIRHLLKIKS